MLMEFRGSVMTAKEIMELVGQMDKDRNLKVSFIELCCAFFNKSYDELFNFVDEEARQRAIEEAKKLSEAAKKAEEEIERAKKQKELQAQLRAAALERESKLVSYPLQLSSRGMPILTNLGCCCCW
jgi:predicted Rossmann-fold nucleotide-binding protein